MHSGDLVLLEVFFFPFCDQNKTVCFDHAISLPTLSTKKCRSTVAKVVIWKTGEGAEWTITPK